MTLTRIIYAPFESAQVDSINAYQQSGRFHPFTCQTGDRERLVAYPAGLECPRCGYAQDWVHTWMADWTWQQSS